MANTSKLVRTFGDKPQRRQKPQFRFEVAYTLDGVVMKPVFVEANSSDEAREMFVEGMAKFRADYEITDRPFKVGLAR